MSTPNSNDLSFTSLPDLPSDYTPTVEESGLSTTASSSILDVDYMETENKDGHNENEDEDEIKGNYHESKIRLSTLSLKNVPGMAQMNDSLSQHAITSIKDALPEETKFIAYQSLNNITKDIYDYIMVSPDSDNVLRRKKSDFFKKNIFAHKNKDNSKKRKKKVKILKASWKDESGKDREVALKKVESLGVFDCDKSKMDKESLEVMENINLLYRLSYHQNLLRIFGYTTDPSTLNHFLILQYASGGNLRRFLREHHAELTWSEKLGACTDLASGLKYIHDHDIIHLALVSDGFYEKAHSRNILYHNQKFLISDLGISKSNVSNFSSILPYTDPRYLANMTDYQQTKESDIYALGILMHEISAGRIPYNEYLTKSEVADEMWDGFEKDITYLPELSPKIVYEGYRQQPIFGTPSEYVALYQQCWQADPMLRPSVDEVLTRLDAMNVDSDMIEKEIKIYEIEKVGGERNNWNVDGKEVNKGYSEKGDRGQKGDVIYVQDAGVNNGVESGNGSRSVYFSADGMSYPTDSMVYSLADGESCFRLVKYSFLN
ncbi:2642_t:CDS:2 [Acaulospora morrowiae]|uniref:2642_t:CDS:1 n=1 Tax=Acaulospora morrowiae TaxID=94023 RepID=A0A9N9FQG5_9GLOM|nr:2642_t:CDS:2 [Acaulospora morrowiae]